jgi:hypothetical protein
MKNPFKQNDHTGTWVIALVAGAITAGVAAWLYFKKNGGEHNGTENHATDYLQIRIPKKHKQRTDLHELEDIVAHN